MLVGGGGGGGRREAPSAAHCLPGQHAPRLPSSQELENKRKEKKAKTKEKEVTRHPKDTPDTDWTLQSIATKRWTQNYSESHKCRQ